MTAAWALVERELRGLARQGQLFWVRVASGGVAILSLAAILLQDVVVGAGLGPYLFARVHWVLFLTILVLGPVITADCIAQEKREGTLGLLFLTPLTSLEIILGKAVVNGVRGLTIVVASLPVTVFPVLWGGVSWAQLAGSLISLMTAICVALTAGLLASTRHRGWLSAVVWAEIYCLVLALFLYGPMSGLFFIVTRLVLPGSWGPWVQIPLSAVIIGTTVAVLVARAARQLKPLWEKQESSFAAPEWLREVVNPRRAYSIFSWDTCTARDRNPIAWLQEYTPAARLAKWGWCILVLVVEAFALTLLVVSHDHGLQLALGTAVVLGISFSAANSFRTERLNGAIELLLVTPIPPWKLILGRLWGVWVHFFPAVAIQFIAWKGSGGVVRNHPEFSYFLLSSYLFVPALGLYLSMFPWNVLVTWAAGFGIGVVLPWLLTTPRAGAGIAAVQLGCLAQAMIGLGALMLLHLNLRNRAFCFR